VSERFISDSSIRLSQIRMSAHEILLYPLWSRKSWSNPIWKRLVACPFTFCMGLVNLLSGLTGLYFGEAVSWLGWKQVCLTCWIEEKFKSK